MGQDNDRTGKNAFDLFPDVLAELFAGDDSSLRGEDLSKDFELVEIVPSVHRPPPPDKSWVQLGLQEGHTEAMDVPKALLLMSEGEGRREVATALHELGYQVEDAATSAEAIDKVRNGDVATIVLAEGFEGRTLVESPFHTYMKWLPMDRRRTIYYIVTGPALRTCYDLEAFAASANLVINSRHTGYFTVIVKRCFRDYEALIGPFIETINGYGKG